MIDTVMRILRVGPVTGFAVTVIGIAHFFVPRIFEPVNRLGFGDHAHSFTYINGGIETTIGVLTVIPRTRRQATVLSMWYSAYLTSGIVCTQVRLRRELSRDGRRTG